MLRPVSCWTEVGQGHGGDAHAGHGVVRDVHRGGPRLLEEARHLHRLTGVGAFGGSIARDGESETRSSWKNPTLTGCAAVRGWAAASR